MFIDVYYWGDRSHNVTDEGVDSIEHAQRLARTTYADADEIVVKPHSLNDWHYRGLNDLETIADIEPGTGNIL